MYTAKFALIVGNSNTRIHAILAPKAGSIRPIKPLCHNYKVNIPDLRVGILFVK